MNKKLKNKSENINNKNDVNNININRNVKKCLFFNFPDNLGDHVIAINKLSECDMTEIDFIICPQKYAWILKEQIINCPTVIFRENIDQLKGLNIQNIIPTDFVLYDNDLDFIKQNKVEDILLMAINRHNNIYNKTNLEIIEDAWCVKDKNSIKKINDKVVFSGIKTDGNIYMVYENFFNRMVDVHKPLKANKEEIENYRNQIANKYQTTNKKEIERNQKEHKRKKYIVVSLSSKRKEKMVNPHYMIAAIKEMKRWRPDLKVVFVDNSDYTRKVLDEIKPNFKYEIQENLELPTLFDYIKKAKTFIGNDSGLLHVAHLYDVENKFVFINEKLTTEENKAKNSLFWLPPDRGLINLILDEQFFNNENSLSKETEKILKGKIKDAVISSNWFKLEDEILERYKKKMKKYQETI